MDIRNSEDQPKLAVDVQPLKLNNTMKVIKRLFYIFLWYDITCQKKIHVFMSCKEFHFFNFLKCLDKLQDVTKQLFLYHKLLYKSLKYGVVEFISVVNSHCVSPDGVNAFSRGRFRVLGMKVEFDSVDDDPKISFTKQFFKLNNILSLADMKI